MKFLIVDDDRVSRELLLEILAPYGGCDLAFDGNEAADVVRLALDDGAPYDLVCLDIMMPGADGHQALDSIRRLEREHGVLGSDGAKVIMTTALKDSKHCIRSFREGCESYVTKPIKQEQFLQRVHELLGDFRRRPPAEEPDPRPAKAAAERESRRSEGERYLVVDDDAVCRALIKDMLSPYGRCGFAYDGQEAVDAVRLALEDNQPYDLITLDIMMPGMDGHSALKAIRQLEAEHGILGSDGVKVVMTTALRDSKHCIRSFKEGCECFVTKPINEDELLEKIRGLGLLKNKVSSGA